MPPVNWTDSLGICETYLRYVVFRLVQVLIAQCEVSNKLDVIVMSYPALSIVPKIYSSSVYHHLSFGIIVLLGFPSDLFDDYLIP